MSWRWRSIRDTGRVTLVRLTAVDDYGVLVNPMVAAGQAHGAIAQGAGQALLEHAVYDAAVGPADRGVVHGLRDAARRRSASFDLGFNGTRCTTNPLGVKGCGEAGAIAASPGDRQCHRGCAGTARRAPISTGRRRRFGCGRRCTAADRGKSHLRIAPAGQCPSPIACHRSSTIFSSAVPLRRAAKHRRYSVCRMQEPRR